MNSVTGFLTRRLKLKVNEAKSAVARPVERKFLGFSFSNNKEPKRRIAPKALLRCKQKIRELTRRTRGISLEQMTKELAAYLRGWKSYFGYCQTPSLLKTLDHMDPASSAFHDLEAMETRHSALCEATSTRGR
jgi:RNA-directed DNA polymerase